MDKTKSLWFIFVLGICGVLFSGYLSFSSLILQTCPLNEPCAIFLGLPTCVYGFAMYTIILLASITGLFCKKDRKECSLKIAKFVSLAGIIFSGYFTIKELFFTTCAGGQCAYGLGLPTCSYGLVMYVAVFVISVLAIGCCFCGKGCCAPKTRARETKPEAGTAAGAEDLADAEGKGRSKPSGKRQGKAKGAAKKL